MNQSHVLLEIQKFPTDGDEEREPDVECVVKGAVITTCEWRCCLIGKTRTTFSSPRNKLSSSASANKNQKHICHTQL